MPEISVTLQQIDALLQKLAKVQQARDTMHTMVEAVGRVSEVIGEIHAGSHAQSSRIAGINLAVRRLDQMTR